MEDPSSIAHDASSIARDVSRIAQREPLDLEPASRSFPQCAANGDMTRAARDLFRDWTGGAKIVFDTREYDIESLDIRGKLELLAAMAGVRRICTPLVAGLLASCEVTATQLFREYVSKNVLNHFRQDRGYKTGEYRKFWDGREDNIHLAQILEDLAVSDEELPRELYKSLDERYDYYLGAGKAV